MAAIQVTQIRSGIGGRANQRATLRSLGLKRIGDVVVKEDRPEILGMVATVTHLVRVEPVATPGGSAEAGSGREPVSGEETR